MKQNEGNRGNADNQKNTEMNRQNEASGENRSDNSEEFPGYPHYPAKDDIMHPANRMEKVTPDPEKLTRSGAYIDPKSFDKPVSSSLDMATDMDDELLIVPGTEADVTKEDLLLLGEQGIDLDEEEEMIDEEESIDTKTKSGGLDTGLDVPGEELDDFNEEIGEEDEENNYYSLGSDSKDNLEEN